MITRHGTFQRKNLTISTDHFLSIANDFEKFTLSWFVGVGFNYHKKITVNSEILTQHGLCFSFNLAVSEHFFNSDLVSTDFLHEYFKLQWKSEKFNETVPKNIDTMTQLEFFFHVREMFYDRTVNGIFDGHFVYVHDPYELPILSFPYPMHRHNHMYLFVEPILIEIDESLYDLTPEE